LLERATANQTHLSLSIFAKHKWRGTLVGSV
jgi:hypothetical protein